MFVPSRASKPVPLVGRERELGLLRWHLDAAMTGHGSLVLIGGEAGIGKTALAESLCRESEEQGGLVLIGRCYDLTETPPYGPWLELIENTQQTDAFPAIPDAFARRGAVGTAASQADLLRQVRDFFTALAAVHPLVLLLEDLHWADPASLELLRLLARSVADTAVLLLVTYRSDELTHRHPLSPLLPVLVREAGAGRLTLDALDDGAVSALVRRRYQLADGETARLVAHLRERAEGNALFVCEMLRALEETGTLACDGVGWRLGDLTGIAVPTLLREVIAGRVGRLAAESQRLLRVAAVIGQEVPLALWAVVVEITEEDLIGVVEEATAAHLLVPTADGLGVQFAHALVREALYEGILPLRRHHYHRRLGEALAARPHPDPDPVAYHFEQARDTRAVEWLVTAGDRADRLYAYVTAADRLERALALLGEHGADRLRGWLLVRLGILYRLSDLPRSLAALDAAEPAVRAAGDAVLTAYAPAARGAVLGIAGRGREGLAELKAGVAAIKALPDGARAAVPLPPSMRIALETDAESTYVFWLGALGYCAEARAYGEALLATRAVAPDADGTGAVSSGHAHMGLGVTYAALGLPERAAAAMVQAREGYRRLGHHSLALGVSYTLAASVLLRYETDRPMLRRAAMAEAASDWARVASAGVYSPEVAALAARTLQIHVAAVEGNWIAARQAAVAFYESGHATNIARQRLSGLGPIALGQGEYQLGWRIVQALMANGSDTEPGDDHFWNQEETLRLAAGLALATGELLIARRWLEAHDRWLAWAGAVAALSEGQALWARFHRQAGDSDTARAHAERALIHARKPRQPLALLVAHRLLAESDTEAGRYDEAADHLDASFRLAEACQAPHERALTLLALAELRAATHAPEDAVRLLDEVRAICTPLGAMPALARAATLAERIAAAPPAVPAYPAGLSAREVDVLRLVAQGLTNPQIAEVLSLSPRTVGQHLYSIYNKLGVSTRAAATRIALEHHLV